MFTAENVGFRCAKDPDILFVKSTIPPMIRYEDTWHYKQERNRLEKKYAQIKKNKDAIETELKLKNLRFDL